MVAFYKHPSDWGDRQFTPCRPFAKGPRFINMIMTFVLHPLSHYNSIIEPRARFLLYLLLQMFIKMLCPVISSYFLPLSRGSYAIFLFIFPLPTISLSCVPQTTLPLNIARQLDSVAPPSYSAPSRFAPSQSAPSSSLGDVTLEDVMAQLQCMNARLDTLSIELQQVNIHVGRIARWQVTMGGFAPVATPSPPPPVASDSEDEDDDDGDASSTNDMST